VDIEVSVGLIRFAVEEVRGIVDLGVRTAHATARRRPPPGVVLRQAFEIGNRSVFFILVTLGFLGAILNFQTGFQAKRIFGDTSLMGAATLPILVRQLGPTLVGLMVSIRVGTGIAAEIGSMVVTEQVDALRMSNAGPIDYLVKPRVLAGTLMVPVLWVVGTTSAWVAGMWITHAAFQTNPETYINFDLVRAADVLEGFVKVVVFGYVIPVIAAHSGLKARGGSEGVGRATTQSVVNASLAVIMLDLVIGGVAFALRFGGGG
jgi:phospholipid/cholesterol/gamma-HCH transport system permease protein